MGRQLSDHKKHSGTITQIRFNTGEEFCLLELVSRIVLPSSEATARLVKGFQRLSNRVLTVISLPTPIKLPIVSVSPAPRIYCVLYGGNKVQPYDQACLIACIYIAVVTSGAINTCSLFLYMSYHCRPP